MSSIPPPPPSTSGAPSKTAQTGSRQQQQFYNSLNRDNGIDSVERKGQSSGTQLLPSSSSSHQHQVNQENSTGGVTSESASEEDGEIFDDEDEEDEVGGRQQTKIVGDVEDEEDDLDDEELVKTSSSAADREKRRIIVVSSSSNKRNDKPIVKTSAKLKSPFVGVKDLSEKTQDKGKKNDVNDVEIDTENQLREDKSHESNDSIMEGSEIEVSQNDNNVDKVSNKKKRPKNADSSPSSKKNINSAFTKATTSKGENDDDNNNKTKVSHSTSAREDDPLAAARELLAVSVAPVVAVAAPAPAIRESFLSDSLTEEERRTRTRYIPAVEGMHSLWKQEVKRDIALARTLPVPGTGKCTATGAKSKSSFGSYHHNDSTLSGISDTIMEDVDKDEHPIFLSKDITSTNDDDRDGGTPGGLLRVQVVPDVDLVLPSAAFRPPPSQQQQPSSTKDENDDTKPDNRTAGVKRAAPGEVESITAFTPPRLPESISLKKKHRMLKWQRRPTDMDNDINIYKQVVLKQRDELKRAEAEFQRVQTIDNHLRRHFLHQIKSINEQMALVNNELVAEQNKCLKATEWYLPTSRARGRNDGKTGSKAMRDIIHGLRRLDAELHNKRELMRAGKDTDDKPVLSPAGVGGVSGASFVEWHRNSKITPNKVASAWIVPNDRVVLPNFGSTEGVAVKFFPYSPLDVTEPPSIELFPPKSPPVQRTPVNHSSSPWLQANKPFTPASNSGPMARKPKKKGLSSAVEYDKSPYRRMLAPRFAVKLPFGVGFFTVDSVVSGENPSAYTNERIAERWKGLLETASVVAPTLDVGALVTKSAKEVNEVIQEYERAISTDDVTGSSRDVKKTDGDINNKDDESRRVVPYGSNLIPTVGARGAFLEKASMAELNQRCAKLYHGGKGVLGKRDNQGVTKEVRDLEDQNEEYLHLQAKVLQLRNQLYRQRRIRILNEKTYNATKERATRVEALVAEMRTDLKTLKARLDDEIQELGITEETAERILTSYYKSLDVNHKSASTNKAGSALRRRSSRVSSVDDDNDKPGSEGILKDSMQVDAEQ